MIAKKISTAKLLIVALLTLLMTSEFISPPDAKAKAYFASRMEMCSRADLIAVVDIGPVQPSAHKGKTWTYSQQAQAKVEKIFQGSAPATITICGGEDFICARCNVSQGKTLAFLKKDGDIYSGSNWSDSFRPVKDGTVNWLKTPLSRLNEVKTVKLTQVEQDVKNDLAAAPTMKNLVEPYKSLSQLYRFCDGIRGEAQTMPEYKAYQDVLSAGKPGLATLKVLSRYATPAGRLYAASAIYVISQGKDKSALQNLADSDSDVLYESGCEGIRSKEGEIARALLKDGKFQCFSLK